MDLAFMLEEPERGHFVCRTLSLSIPAEVTLIDLHLITEQLRRLRFLTGEDHLMPYEYICKIWIKVLR
jgi:hypothetical protein